ncbi:MAG: DNA recombination protein RmuC [Gammaproteobacteria bacterium]|nr:DNA recombination protein RmuC [Gammaproteobacteria bacterium]
MIHLPDDKDIVIDSKVSLVAYERALACEDEAERERLMRQHVADLRVQVKRLSEQDYDRLQGVRSLDFVLLFVPIESAFTLAMQQDPNVFTEAFNRRIVIVSPTTLMMTLRIIHNVWRYEKQSRNAQEIAQRAGALYDKLRAAMEDMTRLGNTLRSADQTYQDAMKKLATGRGNLVRQVEQLRELGALCAKPLPRKPRKRPKRVTMCGRNSLTMMQRKSMSPMRSLLPTENAVTVARTCVQYVGNACRYADEFLPKVTWVSQKARRFPGYICVARKDI